jgi:serine/threonine-protein kinase
VVVLTVTAGPHRGARFEYDCHDTLLVGRGSAANLQLLDDPQFSRHHFILEFNPPRVYLRDLGSSNGTKVNGRTVKECFLNEGDEISGGRTQMVLSLARRPAVPTAAAPTRSFSPGPATILAQEPTGPVAPPPADELPTFIPGYEVMSVLGRGGMGVVYRARHRATGWESAVKLMLPESAASERAIRMFLREVSVLSNLDHPNVVRYHEVGSALGHLYFVMEYVPAWDLLQRLRELPDEGQPGFACRVIARALDGLAHAHGKGIVYRDFKPANLLVTASPVMPEVKVSDFGIAKSFQDAGFSGMTLSGETHGTLSFMAPEQLTHCRMVRPAADLYSVGASLYYLLAGRPPLNLRAGREPICVILDEEPLPLDQARPGLPSGLAGVVHRALAKDPAQRFPDAATMRTALQPFFADDA